MATFFDGEASPLCRLQPGAGSTPLKRAWIEAGVLMLLSASHWSALAGAQSNPKVVPPYDSELMIESIGGTGQWRRVAQMTWGPAVGNGAARLYLATMDDGIYCADYDEQGQLSNDRLVSAYKCLGIAFHSNEALGGAGGAVLYLTEFRGSGTNGVLRRLTDSNGDGVFGGSGEVDQAIVNNIPLGNVPYGHHLNQIVILGDTLFVGIGVGSDVGDNENAYTGTISWIEDLKLLDSDTSTPNLAGFDIVDFATDATPYTSTAPDKLRVHSNGARNPFGLEVDGAGRLWVTMNQIDQPRPDTAETCVPQDQLFQVVAQADYAYRDGRTVYQKNSVHDWRSDPAVLGAGFFDPSRRALSLTADLPDENYQASNPGASSGLPHGLGPHSSADGFCFYTGNHFSVQWHKDAFVTRQSEQIDPPLGPYEDLAAVDLDTGEVRQVVTGLFAPLDALSDGAGNVLIAEVTSKSRTKVYRLRAIQPILGLHPFRWAGDADGRWSDRTRWDPDFDGDGAVDSGLPDEDREVPDAWGAARYSVEIDQPSAPRVTLDRDVRVEIVTLHDHLHVPHPSTLTVTDVLHIVPGGLLSGRGTISGKVRNEGALRPSHPLGVLRIRGDYIQSGSLAVEIGEEDAAPRIDVAGTAVLSGAIAVTLRAPFRPAAGDRFVVIVADSIVDQGVRVLAPPPTFLRTEILSRDDGREMLQLVTNAPPAPRR